MIFLSVCVGSSCHLKGAPDIVQWLQKRISDERLQEEIVLTGCFCAGQCNRVGVTITVQDTVYTGVTMDSLREFWTHTILPAVAAAKEAMA